MLTIPYLGFETFKNYTLQGDTYLSSPCILSKVMMLNVSQKLIWSGKICYTNIVVSSLIMRSDDVLLKKRCISLRFYLVTFFIIILLLWDKPSDTLSPNSITISVQMSLFFNGLWPFVIKVTSGFKKSFKEMCSWWMYLHLPPFQD